MQEHLDEAAFHWRQRERALASWEESLEEIAEGDEARLLAHVEGLVIGGAPVARRLLLPALEGEDLWQVGPAALALLGSEGDASLALLLRELIEGPEESRPEIRRALEFSGRSRSEALLLPQVARVGPEAQAMLLEVLAAWQADPGSALPRTLGADDAPALWVAALRSARFTARPVAEGFVRQGLAHAEDSVRCAALETGLILGLREPWQACRRLVGAPDEAGRLARLALALGGEPADVKLLLKAAEEWRLREDALWALGFSGRRAAAEALVNVMQREEAGSRLAAESLAIITGLDLTEHLLMDEPDDEAPSSAEEGTGDTGAATGAWRVPPPPGRVRSASVCAWWQKAQTRFDERGRFVRGAPWSPAAVFAELTRGPACLRPVWALELAVRTRGGLQVATSARAAFQLRQLQGSAALRLDSTPRGFDSLMTA
ncbi:TIGR02270 family protein [Myxococcus sp. NMCA1]|uniref:TIGR02270 family protein n=1 Tax=Myxococcus sp. NMCA1 TaxID=2996785 RepID=UPI002285E095|nr:TIGR02270 family protein [Myxococcus sp. NMCA1]WAM26718.1 TIGR02270 family protein [Myxococcus sp. NMCA1]